MGQDPRGIAQAGNHVFEDAGFAQEILRGEHDYPEIRDAILADLAEFHQQTVADLVRTADPAGNPQVLLNYIQNGPKPGGMRVQNLIDQAQYW
jgi:hypothetical protein